ncbi:hypothetical protein FB451DRAFT_1403029 [Mycena latifolia]|nr:hypothetical protein FB451DRAFT_1403029 [Mycena latifolia]
MAPVAPVFHMVPVKDTYTPPVPSATPFVSTYVDTSSIPQSFWLKYQVLLILLGIAFAVGVFFSIGPVCRMVKNWRKGKTVDDVEAASVVASFKPPIIAVPPPSFGAYDYTYNLQAEMEERRARLALDARYMGYVSQGKLCKGAGRTFFGWAPPPSCLSFSLLSFSLPFSFSGLRDTPIHQASVKPHPQTSATPSLLSVSETPALNPPRHPHPANSAKPLPHPPRHPPSSNLRETHHPISPSRRPPQSYLRETPILQISAKPAIPQILRETPSSTSESATSPFLKPPRNPRLQARRDSLPNVRAKPHPRPSTRDTHHPPPSNLRETAIPQASAKPPASTPARPSSLTSARNPSPVPPPARTTTLKPPRNLVPAPARRPLPQSP